MNKRRIDYCKVTNERRSLDSLIESYGKQYQTKEEAKYETYNEFIKDFLTENE